MHATPHALRILVVEDEQDIREMLVASLSQEAEVQGAADGQEALDLLAQGPMPSVILLDLRMPRVSGEGVLRALDQLPSRPPVVTMSACTAQAPRGSAAHLDKPFTIREVSSVLRRVCAESATASAAGAVDRGDRDLPQPGPQSALVPA
jgi:CheY-like chemotaxis protein